MVVPLSCSELRSGSYPVVVFLAFSSSFAAEPIRPFAMPKNMRIPGRNWNTMIIAANPTKSQKKSPVPSSSAPLAANADEATVREAALRHDINDRFRDATTFRVGAGYRITESTRLRAAAGSGVKNPGFFEHAALEFEQAQLTAEKQVRVYSIFRGGILGVHQICLRLMKPVT